MGHSATWWQRHGGLWCPRNGVWGGGEVAPPALPLPIEAPPCSFPRAGCPQPYVDGHTEVFTQAMTAYAQELAEVPTPVHSPPRTHNAIPTHTLPLDTIR